MTRISSTLPGSSTLPARRSRQQRAATKRLAAAALVVALSGALASVSSTAAADDADLFSAKLSPNVMLIADNSRSMFTVIYHPAYDPDTTYTSPCSFSDKTVGPGGDWSAGSRSECFRTRSLPGLDTDANGTADAAMVYPANYLRWIFSDAVTANYDIDGDGSTDGSIINQINNYSKDWTCKASGSYKLFHRDRATASRQILREVLCEVDKTGDIRFGFSTFRTGGYPNGGYVVVPINDVTVDDDNDPTTPEVTNTYTLNGATQSHLDHLYDTFEDFEVDSATPLGETLFQIYTYFMSRDSSELPYGDTNKDGAPDTSAGRFPVYQYVTDPVQNSGGSNVDDTTGWTVPPCPVEAWCQKNFIILITDGEPTTDKFDKESDGYGNDTAVGFDDFTDLIGNYKDNVGTTTSQCYGVSGWDQCWYLDDIAKFIQDHDFLPDDTNTDFPNKQNIDLYTLGFATNDAMNDFLKSSAEAGGGTFNASGDPEELKTEIVKALSEIIEKSQVFTAPTIPASRSSDRNNFYLTFFRPSDRSSFWEGHLKSFDLNAAGEIRDEDGTCIFRDPDDSSVIQCTSGTLQVDADGWWDVADEIPAATSRNLYVSNYGAGLPSTIPSTPLSFTGSSIAAADLAVDFTLAPLFANVGAGITGLTDAEGLADSIVQFVRGCEFAATGCIDRGTGNKLWDIFHSAPTTVAGPNAAIRNAGYREFASQYAHRTKVIYVGSNGGFVHGFNAGTWQTTVTTEVPVPPAYDRGTGTELFGFMPYPARQNIKWLALDQPPRDYYFVDGSPSVADVWLYPSETAVPGDTTTWTQWHTVLIGGMRQGGEAVYAIDVTNPDGVTGGPAYPSYLWEFPCEDSTDLLCTGAGTYTWSDYMGETWSKPVITRVKMAADCTPPESCPPYFDRWVAIFGAGYNAAGDPNEETGGVYDGTSNAGTSRKGRAIFMVDITSGKVLATKRFDHSSTNGDPRMKYAFPSSPAVFDLNYDGYADVVYIGDLGGQMWKWVISKPAEDTISSAATGDIDQPQWDWVRIMAATPCPAATCGITRTKAFYNPPTGTQIHGKLFLSWGSGERAQINYVGSNTEERNRLYVMRDVDPFERNTPESDPDPRYHDSTGGGFVDVETLSGPCVPPPSPTVGFYFEGEDGEKFTTESTIFAGGVLTGSFIPATTTNSCDATGDGYFYYFDLYCGEGKLDDPDTSDPDDKKKKRKVGKGPPTPPKASMSSLEDQDDTCDNKVYAFSAEGEGIIDSTECLPGSGVRTKSWKDVN